ncbi:MAG: hypothetical protein WC856_10060 [Methylococcaceae bacterium]|jgi:hypothetical protein
MQTLRKTLQSAIQSQTEVEVVLAKSTETLAKAQSFVQALEENLTDKQRDLRMAKDDHAKNLAESFANGTEAKVSTHDSSEIPTLEAELEVAKNALQHCTTENENVKSNLVSAKTAVHNAALDIIRYEAALVAEEGIAAQEIVKEKLTSLLGVDFAAMRFANAPDGNYKLPLVLNQTEIDWMHNLSNSQLVVQEVEKGKATEAWLKHYQELLLDSAAEL